MGTRRYFVGGNPRTIEEVDDVVAVHMDAVADRALPGAAGLEAMGTPVARAARGAPARSAIPGDVASAFARADWHFILPSQALRADLAARGATAAEPDVGRVFRRQDGSVVVATSALTVQLRPDLSDDQCAAILRERNLHVVRRLPFAPNTYEVKAVGRRDALAASEELQADDRFVFAEPVFVEQIKGRRTPDDPRFGDQWQWRNELLPGADVHAEAAWDHTRGAGVRVAVIDNGFDANHEDLAAGLDRESGYFGRDGTFQAGVQGMPDGDHGTFCAGMVGARADNGRGGCGAAPECALVLIACLPDQVGAQTTIARAVAYAAQHALEIPTAAPGAGVDIIACSLGPNGAEWELQTVLRLALEFAASNGRGGRGCPIFWAVSNGRNVDIALDEVVSHPDVIAVGRSTRYDTEHDCARGPKLEYLAPGVDVYSTYSGNRYGTGTGTSYAAPCAAGVAALVLAANPALARDGLRAALVGTCDRIGDLPYDANGRNDDHGHGRINAEAAVLRALAAAGTMVAGAPAAPGDTSANQDDLHRIEVRAQTVEQLRSFLRGTDLDLGCRPAVRQRPGELVVEAFATRAQIDGLRASRRSPGVAIDIIENASATGRTRQSEVGPGNRFASRQMPRGLGIKE
jgi:subtilisin family serine protease